MSHASWACYSEIIRANLSGNIECGDPRRNHILWQTWIPNSAPDISHNLITGATQIIRDITPFTFQGELAKLMPVFLHLCGSIFQTQETIQKQIGPQKYQPRWFSSPEFPSPTSTYLTLNTSFVKWIPSRSTYLECFRCVGSISHGFYCGQDFPHTI